MKLSDFIGKEIYEIKMSENKDKITFKFTDETYFCIEVNSFTHKLRAGYHFKIIQQYYVELEA